jgi:hypothetical protein
MKSLLRITYFAILYGLLSVSSRAATPGAPYFHIAGNRDETSDERMALKSSAAKVEIDGTIARVRLTQRYGNAGTELATALQRSLALSGGGDRSRSFLLVTDGYITADAAVLSLIRDKIGTA